MEKFFTKRNVLIIGLLIMALLSAFVFSGIASSSEFHAKTIKALDDKKITVMELTAATVTTSTLIAAIPSDATTPLASQIVELSEYLLIIVGIIFLEKILLTLTGYVSFSFLIPIACVVLLFMVWVIKLIFGIDIPVKNIRLPKIKKEEKITEKIS